MATQTVLAAPLTLLPAKDVTVTVTAAVALREPSDSDSASETTPKESHSNSRLRKVIVTVQLSGVNFASSAINGLVILGLPAITADLGIPPSLAFWPSSVSSLANASTLLLAGAVADSIGPRKVNLAGGLVSGAFMIGAGAAQSGGHLVGMRALQGIGYAMHLASSVAIVTQIMPRGRSRNFAFACLGLSQPLGFSFGLVVGGALQDAIGWRAGWFIYGALTLLFTAIAVWALPKEDEGKNIRKSVANFKKNVDWVGAILASTFMALLSYLLATLSTDTSKIRAPESIVSLIVVLITLPSFFFWVHHQVKQGKPALIPNSLWKNRAFSTICATVAISFGVTTSMELFASLYFQEVLHLSALDAGLRILPSLVVAVLLNLTTGLFVDKMSARWLVTISSVVCAIAPLLMAVIQTGWPYWANAFIAQIFAPVSTDILFTVGLIIISDVFPDDTQALAGAVFNTASQFGQALCIAVMQIVSTSVTANHGGGKESFALLEGMRAAFWTMFAFMLICGLFGVFGLRDTGRVGLKRD